MREFDHERLDVYRMALEFVATANTVRKKLPPGQRILTDQLDRATLSIPLNIAEGAGEFAAKEKARFYRIARRSATECAAILDVVERLGLSERATVEPGRTQLRRIVAMLVSLAKSKEQN